MDENNSEINNDTKNSEEHSANDTINKNYVSYNVENNTTKNIKKVKKVKHVKNIENKQRKAESQVVVQYRKPSIFSAFLLILIGALLATIAFLVMILFKTNKEVIVYDESEEEIVEQEPEEQVDLNLYLS